MAGMQARKCGDVDSPFLFAKKPHIEVRFDYSKDKREDEIVQDIDPYTMQA